jgi:hypothetical protein
MAQELKAHLVSPAGHDVSVDGRHGILVFVQANDEKLILAIPIEQVSKLIQASASIVATARQKLGADALPAPTFRVDRWSVSQEPNAKNAKVLTFVTRDFEICFEVTEKTSG